MYLTKLLSTKVNAKAFFGGGLMLAWIVWHNRNTNKTRSSADFLCVNQMLNEKVAYKNHCANYGV